MIEVLKGIEKGGGGGGVRLGKRGEGKIEGEGLCTAQSHDSPGVITPVITVNSD